MREGVREMGKGKVALQIYECGQVHIGDSSIKVIRRQISADYHYC